MIAVDSSVVIAGFASWHEAHEAATRALDDQPALVAHCALEAYSVLTRLPPPHRARPALVAEFLEDRFREPPLVLSAAALHKLVPQLQRAGLRGGAVYDGLVAATAAEHRVTLLTLDRRAAETYRSCSVTHTLLT